MQMVQTLNQQTYGDGTTYITSYSGNNDRRGPYFESNKRDPEKVAYVDVKRIGLGFSNISISPSEIRVTSRGYDNEGNLVTGDDNALVTNKPRTPNLAAWNYPSVPQDVKRNDNKGRFRKWNCKRRTSTQCTPYSSGAKDPSKRE